MSNASRSKKMAIPVVKTQAQIYMEEKFKNLIGKLLSQFRSEMKDSSSQSTSDESHILYYNAFLNHYMEIEQDVFVTTSDWALAFMQESLQATTRQLLQIASIHFLLDVERRRRLIQRIAVWMMEKYSKNLDPYSWSCTEQFQDTLSTPTHEQVTVINKEIDAFPQWDFQPFPDNGHNNLFQAVFDDIITDNFSVDKFESTIIDQITNADNTNEYTEAFKGFVTFLKMMGSKINPAHVTCALTRCTIPNNTDIFFDSVQVSNSRVTDAAAVAMRGCKEVAKKMWKQYIRRDFLIANKQFRTVADICPVKRLALYRAVKFLVSVRKGLIAAKTSDFNSEVEDHNVYPNPEEREQIDEGIVEIAAQLFTQAREKLGDEFVDNFSTPDPYQPPICVLPSEPGTAFQNPESNPEAPPGANAYSPLDLKELLEKPVIKEPVGTWLNTNVQLFTEGSSVLASATPTYPNMLPTNDYDYTYVLPSNHHGSNLLFSMNFNETPQQSTTQAYVVEPMYSSPCCNKFINHVCNDSRFSGNSNRSSAPGPIHETSPTPAVVSAPQITIGNHAYPIDVYKTAQLEFKNGDTIKAGMYLFDHLFTHEQKITCTVGGKKGTTKYPQDVVNAIFAALKKFEVDSGKPPTSEGLIRTKVFVEKGNQYRRKYGTYLQ